MSHKTRTETILEYLCCVYSGVVSRVKEFVVNFWNPIRGVKTVGQGLFGGSIRIRFVHWHPETRKSGELPGQGNL